MHTSAQNSRSVRLGSGIMYINNVNIGLLEAAELDTTRSVLQIKADNGRLPPRVKLEKVMFKATLYEVNLANFDTIDGAGVSSTVAAAPVSPTAEVLQASGTWNTNAVLYFAGKQATGGVATSITVKNGATTLTLGTDYAIVNDNGRTGITRVGTALTLTGIGINVAYTYTPAASRVYTYSDIIKALSLYEVRFENTDELGKKFIVTIPQGYNVENLKLGFGSDDKLDEAMKFPISFEAYPDATNRMLVISDEQAP